MEPNRTRGAPLLVMDNMDFRHRALHRGTPFSGLDHLAFSRYTPPFFAFEHLDSVRVRPAPAPAAENPSRVTDFSIDRILSADLGNKTPTVRTPDTSCMTVPYIQCVFYPSYPVMPRVIDAQTYPENVTRAGQRSHVERQQWKPRVRTVFTDRQLRRLEELFERTRYPCPETRAEVARSIGLSEETVRIWFKNHRARRKKQDSSP